LEGTIHPSRPAARARQRPGRGVGAAEEGGRSVASRRTAEPHVENGLRKLGFTNHSQSAAWAAARHHDRS